MLIIDHAKDLGEADHDSAKEMILRAPDGFARDAADRVRPVRRDQAATTAGGGREALRVLPRPPYPGRERGAARLWHLLKTEAFVPALGALTGNQAVQQVKAGLKAIYLSGWQVAADANQAGEMYPDQSLYPANSVPLVVRRINNALRRADQIARMEGGDSIYWMAPIIADAEAGFGGPLNAFELMRAMIEAGAAGVHFEDQLAWKRNAAISAARCWCRSASISAH